MLDPRADAASETRRARASDTPAPPARNRPSPASCGARATLLDQLQRQLQPLRFLGVDRQRDAAGARRDGELEQARRKLAEHAPSLRELIAREQRRQLDRNARRRLDGGARLDAGRHRRDRLVVGREIAHRRRRVVSADFAQHVERMAIQRDAPG